MNRIDHVRGYVPNPDYTQEDWDDVCDNPEWTEEDFANAVPFREVYPEYYAAWLRERGRTETADTELVALTVDSDVLARFRATGFGWQSRMTAALREAASGLAPAPAEPEDE